MQEHAEDLLVGSRVLITVTDPWDFVSDLKTPFLSGTIKKSDPKRAIIIELESSLDFGCSRQKMFLAFPRHGGESFKGQTGTLFCNFMSFDEAQWEISASLGNYTGEFGFMGDVAW